MLPFDGCMDIGANLSQDRTPSQAAGSCGSFHRRSPTGGAAYGIPAKISTLPSAERTPVRLPCATDRTSVDSGLAASDTGTLLTGGCETAKHAARTPR